MLLTSITTVIIKMLELSVLNKKNSQQKLIACANSKIIINNFCEMSSMKTELTKLSNILIIYKND